MSLLKAIALGNTGGYIDVDRLEWLAMLNSIPPQVHEFNATRLRDLIFGANNAAPRDVVCVATDHARQMLTLVPEPAPVIPPGEVPPGPVVPGPVVPGPIVPGPIVPLTLPPVTPLPADASTIVTPVTE